MEKSKKKQNKEKERKNKTSTSRNETKEQKTLKNFLIGVGIFVFVLIIVILVLNSMASFEYKGLKFDIEKFGDIIVYRTFVPLYSKTGINIITGEAVKEHTADYNFYLRNDPRTLDKIPFNGEIILYKEVVINSTDELDCNGNGIIAIKNLANLYELIGANVIKDETAGCDSWARYMFLNIQSGESTKIEQVGPSCFDLYVNNCEILEATERFMIETFIKIDEMGLEPTL